MGHPTRETPSLLWPAIGTILFVLVVPGTVVVYVPFRLSGWQFAAPFFGVGAIRWVGVLLVVCALPVFTDFIFRFIREGRGTPVPVAPTRHLVVHGTFRYVRNPGYVAVVALLFGQALFFGSTAVLLYALGVLVAFHLFVVLYEEPALRRQFGAEYATYRRQVPRWIPRRRRPSDGDGRVSRV